MRIKKLIKGGVFMSKNRLNLNGKVGFHVENFETFLS